MHMSQAIAVFVLALVPACQGDMPAMDPDGGGGGADSGVGMNDGPAPGIDAPRRDAGPIGTGDFDERCAGPGVLRCVGFDDANDIGRTWGANSGTLPGDAVPELDTVEKASGASSLLFTIPSNSGANSSGSYWTNFSDDLSVQFADNATFFVQWRQRFSPEFIETYYEEGGGWKQAIIGTGDRPGCSESMATSIDSGGNCASSCTSLETVVQNTGQRGFAQMYNSCSGSTSHGAYVGFEEPLPPYDFKLQNARSEPFCLYSQGESDTYFPPDGNCFGYFPNEWMTFQVEISTGPRVADEWVDSYIRLWIAREGQPSELVIDWGPWALTAGDPAVDERFGKVWLLPYHTNKSAAQSHPVGYTWYDELIVSRERIPDPE